MKTIERKINLSEQYIQVIFIFLSGNLKDLEGNVKKETPKNEFAQRP